jgi:hypothetical protein
MSSSPVSACMAWCAVARIDVLYRIETHKVRQIVSSDVIYLVTTWAIPVIVAITFHEAAHGFVAHLLGDDTAWRLGDRRSPS